MNTYRISYTRTEVRHAWIDADTEAEARTLFDDLDSFAETEFVEYTDNDPEILLVIEEGPAVEWYDHDTEHNRYHQADAEPFNDADRLRGIVHAALADHTIGWPMARRYHTMIETAIDLGCLDHAGRTIRAELEQQRART